MLPDPDYTNPFDLNDTDEFSDEEEEQEQRDEGDDLFAPEFETDPDIRDQSTPPAPSKPVPKRPPTPEDKPPLKERIKAWFNFRARYRSMKEQLSDDSKELMHKSHVSQIFHPEIALLLVMNFVFWFTQTSFLMFASHMMPLQYNWSPFFTGLTYVAGSLDFNIQGDPKFPFWAGNRKTSVNKMILRKGIIP